MGSGNGREGGYSMYPPSPTSPTRSHFTAKVKLATFHSATMITERSGVGNFPRKWGVGRNFPKEMRSPGNGESGNEESGERGISYFPFSLGKWGVGNSPLRCHQVHSESGNGE
jgi:hypothetical protein